MEMIILCDGGPKARLRILYKVLAGVAVIITLIVLAPQLGA
jgi:hypothetical protein